MELNTFRWKYYKRCKHFPGSQEGERGVMNEARTRDDASTMGGLAAIFSPPALTGLCFAVRVSFMTPRSLPALFVLLRLSVLAKILGASMLYSTSDG
jgi:hypothetical protein